MPLFWCTNSPASQPWSVSPQVVGHRLLVAKDGTWYLPGRRNKLVKGRSWACMQGWHALPHASFRCCTATRFALPDPSISLQCIASRRRAGTPSAPAPSTHSARRRSSSCSYSRPQTRRRRQGQPAGGGMECMPLQQHRHAALACAAISTVEPTDATGDFACAHPSLFAIFAHSACCVACRA